MTNSIGGGAARAAAGVGVARAAAAAAAAAAARNMRSFFALAVGNEIPLSPALFPLFFYFFSFSTLSY
jgi:hypothetical protein